MSGTARCTPPPWPRAWWPAASRSASQIIWAKERLVLCRGDYHWQHEPCWYAVRTRARATGPATASRRRSGRSRAATRTPRTVHGTQKPVECMRRPMLNNTAPGQPVYEPFSGSGTTIIAAETAGRVCLAMELDPAYVDVAVGAGRPSPARPPTLEGDGRSFAEIARRADAMTEEEEAPACANRLAGKPADPAAAIAAAREFSIASRRVVAKAPL